MSIDNSDIQQKIKIRQRGLTLINSPFLVLDMYAGTGTITKILWSKVAEKVKCIEKEKGKLQIDSDRVESVFGDNADFIFEAKNYNVIDCDAYGLVIYFLKKLIPECKKDTIIFFTEFNPIRVKNNWQYEFLQQLSEMKVRAMSWEKATFSQALYGYVLI